MAQVNTIKEHPYQLRRSRKIWRKPQEGVRFGNMIMDIRNMKKTIYTDNIVSEKSSYENSNLLES